MWIRAIHKVPEEKLAVIVVSHLVEFENTSQTSMYSKRGTEYIQSILRYLDNKLPTITRKWTVKVVQEDNFLKELEQNSLHKNLSTYLGTSGNPGYNLSLLAINLSTNSDSTYCETHFSGKSLGVVDKEDIIELFI